MVDELEESSWEGWGVRTSGCAVCGVHHLLGVAGVFALEPGLGDVPQGTTQNAALQICNFWCGLWKERNYLWVVPVEEIATRVVV